MKEQIRQLAEQARKYADENRSGSFVKYDPEWFVLYNEKFAELIVRESATLSWLHGGRTEARDLVLKHFGFEE